MPIHATYTIMVASLGLIETVTKKLKTRFSKILSSEEELLFEAHSEIILNYHFQEVLFLINLNGKLIFKHKVFLMELKSKVET